MKSKENYQPRFFNLQEDFSTTMSENVECPLVKNESTNDSDDVVLIEPKIETVCIPEEKCQNDNPFPELQEFYNEKYSSFLSKVIKLQTPIIESINLKEIQQYKDYKTKFYTDKYSVDFKNIGQNYTQTFHDILVRIHTNGALLIAVASGNSIIQSSKQIVEINFNINKSDRSNIVIKGKKKVGAMFVKKETILCQVKLEGDDFYHNIRSGVEGRLVEINEIIKTNPNVIKTDPKGNGFVCIMLPNLPQGKLTEAVNCLDLLSEEDYFKYLENNRLKKL